MSKITIWCDGASAGNPGPGGAGWIIRIDDDDGTRWQGPSRMSLGSNITNQQAEILAAYCALSLIEMFNPESVEVISDSEYLVKSMRSEFAKKKNILYWQYLESVANKFNITWTHEKKGTSAQNRMCDREANTAIHMGKFGGRKE